MEQPLQFKDRRAGLIVFGILELILAGLCGLEILGLAAVMLLGSRFPTPNANAMHPLAMLPGLLMFVGLAAFLAAMGIGSILGRRWARALMLIVSVFWLVFGTIGLGVTALLIPKIAAAMPVTPGGDTRNMIPVILTATLIFGAFFFLIIPLALFLFYRSPHVKATCERLDPKERWTDRTPLPVIALALLAGFHGVQLILLGATLRGFPLFGVPVPGPAGKLVWGTVGILLMALAWNVYRRRRWAWFTLMLVMLATSVSAILTFLRFDMLDLMRMYGQAPNAAAAAAVTSALGRGGWVGVIAGSAALWLAFVVWVGRYFRPSSSDPTVPPPSWAPHSSAGNAP